MQMYMCVYIHIYGIHLGLSYGHKNTFVDHCVCANRYICWHAHWCVCEYVYIL